MPVTGHIYWVRGDAVIICLVRENISFLYSFQIVIMTDRIGLWSGHKSHWGMWNGDTQWAQYEVLDEKINLMELSGYVCCVDLVWHGKWYTWNEADDITLHSFLSMLSYETIL